MKSDDKFWELFNEKVKFVAKQMGITEEEAKRQLLSIMEGKIKEENK